MCIPPPRYRAAPRRLPSLLDMSLPHSLAELSCVRCAGLRQGSARDGGLVGDAQTAPSDSFYDFTRLYKHRNVYYIPLWYYFKVHLVNGTLMNDVTVPHRA